MSAHGGAIALESEKGCGAKFRVLLPVPAKAVEAAAVKPVPKTSGTAKALYLSLTMKRLAVDGKEGV